VPDVLLEKAVLHWSGAQIGTGVSVFYATTGGSFVDALHTFFEAIKIDLGAGVRITYPSSGDVIHSSTGHLDSSWSATPNTDTVGTGGGFIAAPAGFALTWLTTTIVPPDASSKTSHRVRGRTFIVPIATNSYDSDGTLQSGTMTRVNAAAAALVSAGTGHWNIWHRPSKGGSEGVAAPVTGYEFHDKVAILRSRR
jgi:hypothetical protein